MNPLSDFGEDTRQMTGAIFTTFPFDFEFHEHAILNVLSKKGIGSRNVVLVDSSKYHRTFEEGSKRPSAGVNYNLAPVSVEGRRVFHPKIYFFSGERRVYGFVGSANLTQKGFTDNGELWSSFSYSRDGKGEDIEDIVVLKEIREFLLDLMETDFSKGVGELARDVISDEIMESCSWMDEKTISQSFERESFFVHNLKKPILSQVLEKVPAEINQAVVVAPYFGESVRVLQELVSQGIEDLELYLQQDRAQIDSESLARLMSKEDVALNIFENSRFVHGKLLLLKTNERSYCLTGSPNPSIQGMLRSAVNGGNIEAGILREADRPDYFDYLVDDELVGEVVGHDTEHFRPAPEPSIEDLPTELELADIRILDAVFDSETTFTGGRLRLTVTGLPQEEGFVIVTGEDGSFELPVSEAELTEGSDDLSELVFEISTDDFLDVLNSVCKIYIRVGDLESRARWVGHRSIEDEEIVREGIESGATSNTPEHIPDLLLGDEDLRVEVLHTVSRIIDNLNAIDTSGKSGSSGGHRRTLPPDWESKGSTTSRDTEEFLEDLYDAWLDQIFVLMNNMGETDSKVLIQDFSRYVEAMNKTTLHLMVIDNHAGQLGYKNQIDFRHISRSRFRELYKGNNSVIDTFLSRLIRREMSLGGEADIESIYDASYQYLFPQLVLTSLIAQEEKESHRRYLREWIDSATGICFPRRHPMPEHLDSAKIDKVVDSVRATVREVLGRYDENANLSQHIERSYLNESSLRDQVLETYARTIIHNGRSGVRSYYDRLYELIEGREVDDISRNVSRCSAFMSKVLSGKDRGSVEVVSTLKEIESDWQDIPEDYYRFLEYAFPFEE